MSKLISVTHLKNRYESPWEILISESDKGEQFFEDVTGNQYFLQMKPKHEVCEWLNGHSKHWYYGLTYPHNSVDDWIAKFYIVEEELVTLFLLRWSDKFE